MKCFFRVLCLSLVLTPLPTHTNYWSKNHPKEQKIVKINPEKKVEYLELYAEQNTAKSQQGLTACVFGSIITTIRLYHRNGHIEPVSLCSALFAVASGSYAGWCAWSAQSAHNQAEDLKKEHNIVVHYMSGEQYLEHNTETQEESK